MNNNDKALYVLQAGMVLDRSVLAKCNVMETDVVLSSIRCNAGLKLTTIERASKFFTAENMIGMIEAKDGRWRLISEQCQFPVSNDQIDAMQQAAKLRASIRAKIAA